MTGFFDPYDCDEPDTLRARIEELEAERDRLSDTAETLANRVLTYAREYELAEAEIERLRYGQETSARLMQFCQDQGEMTPGQRVEAVVSAHAALRADVERLRRPEVVLSAAEALLREAGGGTLALELAARKRRLDVWIGDDYLRAATLAEAYQKLKEARDGK
jgi:hypothetical protein